MDCREKMSRDGMYELLWSLPFALRSEKIRSVGVEVGSNLEGGNLTSCSRTLQASAGQCMSVQASAGKRRQVAGCAGRCRVTVDLECLVVRSYRVASPATG